MRLLRALILDLFLVIVATILAVWLRENFEISADRIVVCVPYLILTIAIAALALPIFGVVQTVWRFTSMRDYLRIIAATTATIVGVVALGFVFNRLDGIARSLPILQGLLIIAFLVGARVFARVRHGASRRLVQSPSAPDASGETVLVVGLNKLAELYLHCVSEFASNRVQIAGVLGPDAEAGLSFSSHRILGPPEQVAEVVRQLEVHGVGVDRIVLAAPFDSLSAEARAALRSVEASSNISLDFFDKRMGFDHVVVTRKRSSVSAEQVFTVSAADLNPLSRSLYCRAKRIINLFTAIVLLVASAPVMALVSGLVAFDVGLPLLFWQQRPGLAGRPFRLYKFRTMGAAHDAHGRRRSDEERVSAIGLFLRRTRLDELPQLFAILSGQMSFVGPRPLLPVDQPAGYSARLLVRPGLTGWAQIKGGRTISAADKAALDVWYVNNVSFALDVKILLGTIPMVLFGEQVTESAIIEAWRDLRAAGICAAASEMRPEPAYAYNRSL